MKARPLILASSSPRRVSILRRLGYRFRQVRPEIDERPRAGENPRTYVRRIALEKAREVAGRNPHHWVVAADTAVVVEGTILGKPRNGTEAAKMLRELSGRWHQVVSGMALVSRERRWESSRVSVTRVRFRNMSEAEIRWYVQTSEPRDKAGAYAIQERGALFVERIVGSASNVVGFPVEIFYDLASKAGIGLP